MNLSETTKNQPKIVQIITDALINGNAKTEGDLFLCCVSNITEGVHYNEFTQVLNLLVKFGEIRKNFLSDKHYNSNYTL